MRLLERDVELDRLGQDFDDAKAGHGHVVLIRGEAGMGKTSLAREFVRLIEGEAHVLTGACDDLLAQRPLAAIRDMSVHEPELAKALEEGTSSVYERVMGLLGRSLRPTVLLIEDVHWADDATLDLIKHVGRRIGDTHGLMVLTYRDEDVATDHPLRFILSDLPASVVDRIVLGPLSLSAVESLAAERGRVVGKVFTESGGNPFLATELLDSAPGDLPASIVEAIHGRVARLGPQAREIAELVSVVPGRAPMGLVRRIFPDWAAGLDQAEQRGVLVLTPTHVAYRHELARRAIESSLTSARRIELNSIVLDNLEDDSDMSLVIHHAAEAGNTRLLLEYSPQAGRDALRVGSNSQAVQYFETLVDHYQLLPPEERARLLDDWSYAAHVVNLLPDSLRRNAESVALWREIGDKEGLGKALRWKSRLAWLSGQREEAEKAADESVEVLESIEVTPELAYAYSTQAQLMMLRYDDERAIETADKAISVALDVGSAPIAAHAMVNRGTSMANRENISGPDTDHQYEALEDAIVFAEEIEFWDEVLRGCVNMAWAGLGAPDLDRAERYSIKCIEICDEHEQPAFREYAMGTLADVKRLKGEWAEAEELARTPLAHPHIWATSEILSRVVLGSILARRGDPEAHEHLERAWDLAATTGEAQRTIPVSLARAELAWLSGDDDTARQILVDEIERVRHVDVAWLRGTLTVTAHLLGIEDAGSQSLAAPHRAVLEGDFATAASLFEKLQLPYEQALTMVLGDPDQAAAGVSILDQLGASATATRARADLRSRGVENIPRRATRARRADTAVLTGRQQEVMALMAEGLTNPEIADRLFVSPRTVDHHVSAILNRLGVTSRQEAAKVFST